MQRVHEPVDLIEAQMLISMLRNEGIDVYLQGEDLIGGVGELPALGLLGLMVANEDVERAQELIILYQQATPVTDDKTDVAQVVQYGTLEC
ncbi:DUF2007 domain-containing protein [Denitrificimonas sp. JX-1]|uniref:DUF2007 domain-containing protein n=1 Tax=Denitrificimonas halotolerans TaxID=3098930 RepID=A0ABU5GQ01_9GAMM|nr:DUF2007 domain-containing protein [Denitrificimonas sp. JX-1]MDY7218266.1 DUF2007 domain-containing protein [Denitrificimonas sp. JX-1]